MFGYNRWANVRMLDALAELTPEELTGDTKSSHPSLLATLMHMLGAEWVWLERWKGSSPASFPDAEGLDSVAAVRERWDALWRDQQSFLSGLEDDGPERPLQYRLFSGLEDARPLGDLMRHVVNHGSYHRGQLVTMLRQLGKVPPSTDYILYLREEAGA